jgi:hypothetical protein
MSAHDIALALAGPRARRLADGSYLALCPVPSHGKGRGDRNPSLRVGDGQLRLLVHCYGGCDRRDVLDELRRRGLLDDARPMPTNRMLAPAKQNGSGVDHERQQHDKARWLWSRRRPIAGSIAETYLRKARRYTGPLPLTLAFLPPGKPEHYPAMIAAFALVDESGPGMLSKPSDVESVHLTLLAADGTGKADAKPNKLIIGSPGGRPIVLAPPNDLLGLAICEGIEDALTAHQVTGLGAWAAGSAGFMPKLPVPDYISSVSIYVHPDKAGQDGAYKLARALRTRPVRPSERKPLKLFVPDDRSIEFYPAERPIEVVMEGI